jgi:glycosyltransferase 2 family protein
VVGFTAVIIASEDTLGIKAKLTRIAPSNFVLPICLSLFSYACRFARWRFILRKLGYCVAIKNDVIFYLSGFALTMTPGKSGETIRSAFLLQADVPVASSLSAFVIERFFDLLIVASLASLFFIAPLLSLALLIVALGAISFAGAHLPIIERWASVLKLPSIVLRLVNILSNASAALGAKSVLLYALLGGAAWAAQGLGFYCILGIFTQDISMFSAISTYCAGLFAGAASMVPGGLGVTEGSLAWLLHSQGMDQGSALLSALLSRLCTLWLAVAIGCCALAAIIKGIVAAPKPLAQG